MWLKNPVFRSIVFTPFETSAHVSDLGY
jgi:hypothetical protein